MGRRQFGSYKVSNIREFSHAMLVLSFLHVLSGFFAVVLSSCGENRKAYVVLLGI